MKKHQLATLLRLLFSITGRSTEHLARRMSLNRGAAVRQTGTVAFAPGYETTASPRREITRGSAHRATAFRLVLLSIICALSALANVCTPLNVPTNGPFPAVVNGIDAIDWSVARIQWTSDATSATPATQQRIQYATAAQWAASPGTYPQNLDLGNTTVTSPNIVQGWVLSNLLPSTTYHVLGQSMQGGAWCSATDETFTTLAAPSAPVAPALPTQFINASPAMTTIPTVTGTHWVYGSNCGTAGPTAWQNVQDCFNKAQPGDGIYLQPGVTYAINQIVTPNNPNAISMTCTQTSSTCSVTGTAPANGTQVRFFAPPTPVNTGATYKIINSSGSSFQISYDGVNPITFQNSGGSPAFYEVWPLTQNYIVVTTTASSSALPPPGVGLNPSDYAQYSASMPILQMEDTLQSPMIYFNELASYYWFQNVTFTVDAALANSNSGNGVDPLGYNSYVGQPSPTNDHIIYNQCAFLPPGPPTRTWLLGWDGSNIGLFNSYLTGLDWWQPFLTNGAGTYTSSAVNYPAFTFYWVGTGGSIGTRKSCAAPSGGASLNVTGGGSGSYVIYVDPTNCNIDAQVTNGITATGTNMTVTNVATPAFPTYSYTHTGGAGTTVFHGYNVLTLGEGTITSGAISSFIQHDGRTMSSVAEGGGGLQVSNGPGPYMTINNYIQGAGITGMFFSDNMANGNSPCGWSAPCPLNYNTGDVTVQRNTITTNPCYFQGFSSINPCWNGGYYSWRNMDEVKSAVRVWQDGNIWGPYYTGIGQGACGGAHLSYNGSFGFLPTQGGYPSYINSSDWTYTNNTCSSTGEGGFATAFYYNAIWPPYPYKNIKAHNNLLLNVNGYAQTSFFQPYNTSINQSPTSPVCPHGQLDQSFNNGQNFLFDHNTVYGEGGCFPMFFDGAQTLMSGIRIQNNIFNLVNDPGTFSGYNTGTIYSPLGNGSIPNCNLLSGNALFACYNNFTWADNVILGTWTNSFPGSQVEFTTAQINSAEVNFPSNTYWPNANTLAGRVSQISWINAPASNFRLNYRSPYISGASASSDGLDIGIDQDALESAQGKVSNVHTFGTTSTSTTIGLLAPDSFGCGVDWGTTNFTTGSGTWTRVANSGGQRVQNVTLTGLPAHALIYYRVNCSVQQPTGTVQLP